MGCKHTIQSNKDWLEAKAKEDGVKALPKGIPSGSTLIFEIELLGIA